MGIVIKYSAIPGTNRQRKKIRFILDSKQSGVSRVATRTHRSTLPRATHAVAGILGLMSMADWDSRYTEEIELLIADISDAFWLPPLHPSERRFFVSRFRGKWYIFLRTAQGSRGAPLSWAALAALLARCIQGLLAQGQEDEGRLQVYVDDPLFALRGTKWHRRRLTTRCCVAFLVLGFRMAFNKAQLSPTVVWIGVGLTVTTKRVEAFIPKEKLDDLLSIIDEMIPLNVVPVKRVRSLAGKSMNIASLIMVWRPCLAPFWASLSKNATRAPKNCIWTRQIFWALVWLREFILENRGAIRRIFDYESFFATNDMIVITCDASPFGIGAWITVGGQIVAWFADALSDSDAWLLNRDLGSHTGQQAYEAFVILVAIRLWRHLFGHQRATLSVRSDNVGALSVLSALKGSGDALTLVAKELALDLGKCEFLPRVIEHIPGVANVTADGLSRKFDPSKQPWSIPTLLRDIPEAEVPLRNSNWWRVYTQEKEIFARHANVK